MAYILVIVFVLKVPLEYVVYLYAVFLVAPLFDPYWKFPDFSRIHNITPYIFALSIVSISIILFNDPGQSEYFLYMLVFTALPEEWFFRGYLLRRIERGIYGNIIVSVGFTVLHLVSQNYMVALMVFFPSLFYGWIYQKTGSLITVIMLHALSNLIFIVYLRNILTAVSLSSG